MTDTVKLVVILIVGVFGQDVAIGELVNVLAAELATGLIVNEVVVVVDCVRLPVLLAQAFGDTLNTPVAVLIALGEANDAVNTALLD